MEELDAGKSERRDPRVPGPVEGGTARLPIENPVGQNFLLLSVWGHFHFTLPNGLQTSAKSLLQYKHVLITSVRCPRAHVAPEGIPLPGEALAPFG